MLFVIVFVLVAVFLTVISQFLGGSGGSILLFLSLTVVTSLIPLSRMQILRNPVLFVGFLLIWATAALKVVLLLAR